VNAVSIAKDCVVGILPAPVVEVEGSKGTGPKDLVDFEGKSIIIRVSGARACEHEVRVRDW
jgi:hypothetical protein